MYIKKPRICSFSDKFVWHLLNLNVTDKRCRVKKFYTKCTNLQYIPINEKHIILGENWLRVEWNPSRQLV